MKFLCISCDTQMKLIKDQSAVRPDDKGSLSIRYECPECLMSVAMLTNSFETQLVTSLGVEIGGETVSASKPDGEPAAKCPFSETARDMMTGSSPTQNTSAPTDETRLQWTAQAAVRLEKIPAFVRESAKKGIENFAKKNGYTQVNEACLDAAKEHFKM